MRHRCRFFAIAILVVGSGAAAIAQRAASTSASRPAIHIAHDALRKLSWQLAVPTGTFSDLSVFDAIDLFHSLNFHHFELTPGQRLSSELTQSATVGALSAEQTAALMAKLKSVKMDVVSYGPVDLGTNDATARSAFAFAKAIKAKIVIATPGVHDLERLDSLATEFGVGLAVRGGSDWYPTAEAMSAALAARSMQVGCYDDTAAWMRLGIDPLLATHAVGSRVIDVRVQDVEANGKAVFLNTGTLDYAGMLAQLKRDGFKGVVTIGNEPGLSATSLEPFIESVNALSDAIAKIAATD